MVSLTGAAEPSSDATLGDDTETIEPMLGHCLIQLEMQLSEEEGGIILPETAIGALGFVGIVVASNPAIGDATGLTGERVIVCTERGRVFTRSDETLFTCPIRTGVLGVVHGEGKVKVTRMGAYGVARCRYCKSKGKGNIILSDNVCPICKRDARTGKKFVPRPVTVSEEQKDLLGYPLKREAKGTVFSFGTVT